MGFFILSNLKTMFFFNDINIIQSKIRDFDRPILLKMRNLIIEKNLRIKIIVILNENKCFKNMLCWRFLKRKAEALGPKNHLNKANTFYDVQIYIHLSRWWYIYLTLYLNNLL